MTAIYNFPDHIKGDTFKSRQITFGIDLTDAIIKMQFKENANSKIAYKFSTEDGSISFVDAVAGIIMMNETIINVAPSTYTYDCQVTTSTGFVRTYFKGTHTIIQDITI